MQIETFANVKTTIQICSVILSTFVNTVSIYLIITKSPKIMGTYRHLMTYFCCCSLMFSFIDAVVQPNIQTYKSAFFMVVDVKNRHLTPWVAELFIRLLCGCIGVTTYGMAIHFVYRFFALERSTVKEFFNLEMENVVYGAAAFFPLDKNGRKFTSYLAFFGLSCYLTLLTIPFLTMLICGLKSWKKVRNLLDHGESEFARNLQMQLYKALIAQTVLPVVFFYIPFGFIFILPIFEINCQFIAAPITLVFAMYSAIDALPTLFFVDYYRKAIIGLREVLVTVPIDFRCVELVSM
ncbi:hypothetical protein B9Z55_012742 [Caenorhabditis nigoni]|uniref:G-protein coupled receptors family 1 profile domain-containing protein n=1 Tax=Caenorhabditis nigoni TaxID=1611254 RepID=A0A2G5TYN6_9PELO|nr:hypothetical protein B9Z55_012742 [Caenorhabditis nigoni]